MKKNKKNKENQNKHGFGQGSKRFAWYGIAFVFVLSIIVYGLYFYFESKDLEGWKSRVHAYERMQALYKDWETEKNQVIHVHFGEEVLEFPREVLVKLEDPKSYETRVEALILGLKKQSTWVQALTFVQGIRLQSDPVQFHPDAVLGYAQKKGLLQDAVPSRLSLESGVWVLKESQMRRFISEKELLIAMQKNLEQGIDAFSVKVYEQAPQEDREAMQKALEALKGVEHQRLKLKKDTVLLEFTPEEWTEALVFRDGQWQFKSLFLSTPKWASFVKSQEQKARDVVIRQEGGNWTFSARPQEGRKVDREALDQAIQGLIAQKSLESVYELEMQVMQAQVDVPEELKKRGIREVIGTGYSNFSGSPSNRIHNIHVGMNLFDGWIVPQGEVFSFTQNMGPIDAAHGWLPELVILGDETKPEYGGGLCQVSSTMFRAALYSGLPIVERHEHSYAVSYYARPYGWGLDASVYDPSPDFKFKNDTQGDILIQAVVEGAQAYFVFYGTSDGRKVEMEGPVVYGHYRKTEPVIKKTKALAPGERRLDQAEHPGFKADWWRTIIYADGTRSERENFHSNYEARPPKYLEGAVEEAQEDLPTVDPSQI